MKDIIILGMGPSRSDCPFDAETWGVNNGYRQVQELGGRLDKLFICHRGQEWDWEGDPVFAFDEINDLVDKGLEIMSLFKVKELGKTTRIPFRRMKKKLKTEYFTDTISYMIAYALYKNTRVNRKGLLELKEPMRIRFYGVDMQTKDEYATERGGIEIFIMLAKWLGAEVTISENSALLRTDTGAPYGFRTINWKSVDPHGIRELQHTTEGLTKMHLKGLINAEDLELMSNFLRSEKLGKGTEPSPSTYPVLKALCVSE